MPLFRLRDGLYVRLARILFGWRFRSFGKKVRILSPLNLIGENNIEIGDDVYVGHKTTLATQNASIRKSAMLTIGRGTHIGNFNHIYCTQQVTIEEDVLTANGVYISDNLHEYTDPEKPIIFQPLRQLAATQIGRGTWIGHNSCVVGARIGRHCVIGANSFVNKDIPDFSVAVGAPAVIIKRYDSEIRSWRKTKPDGSFAN